MAPRCFGFTDDSLHLAFAAAPKLVQGPAADGPVVDRIEYIKYLKAYNRQCLEFALIVEKFVVDYMASYYPTHADVVRDPEMLAMAEQYFYQHDSITYGHKSEP
ncbi:unnamed protein product [Polarella glacialis]|uniref:Lipoxygenase domain-containing protein n=1 Tax=Polarella glacialis TaxID=89957 RepID=A0A813GKA6_POLGL|nr:unnamed protein product [Polarella glacialis]